MKTIDQYKLLGEIKKGSKIKKGQLFYRLWRNRILDILIAIENSRDYYVKALCVGTIYDAGGPEGDNMVGSIDDWSLQEDYQLRLYRDIK